MPKFEMVRYYEGVRVLKTEDLLTAVKICSNYEADLYIDGILAMSPLGLDHEANAELLSKHGIEQYLNEEKHCYGYRYADPAKRDASIYAEMYRFMSGGKPKLSVTIRDYNPDGDSVRFSNVEEMKKSIRETWEHGLDNVHITSFLDDGCEFLSLEEGEQVG